MTIDKAIEVLKACARDCVYCRPCAEHDEAVALAVKGLLVLRSANSLFAGSDALVKIERTETCDGCVWANRVRPQKCSCCRRNLHLKDCYEEGNA